MQHQTACLRRREHAAAGIALHAGGSTGGAAPPSASARAAATTTGQDADQDAQQEADEEADQDAGVLERLAAHGEDGMHGWPGLAVVR